MMFSAILAIGSIVFITYKAKKEIDKVLLNELNEEMEVTHEIEMKF